MLLQMKVSSHCIIPILNDKEQRKKKETSQNISENNEIPKYEVPDDRLDGQVRRKEDIVRAKASRAETGGQGQSQIDALPKKSSDQSACQKRERHPSSPHQPALYRKDQVIEHR